MTGPRASRARIVISGREAAVATVADTPWARMVGLLGHRSLEPDDGMVFSPCRMVHTWFMRFPIDVVFVDSDGAVVKTVERLEPFQWAWGGLRAATTIELTAGAVRSARIAEGDRVQIERCEA